MGYKCAVCGEVHDTLPMDLAFQKPQDYFKVPPAERDKRIKINADLCVIDGEKFFIRGVLPILVHDDAENFVWGIWARVNQESFSRYLELWDADGTKEPPFHGRLSASVPGYPDTDLLEVDVRLGKPSERPILRLRPADHPLVHEQMNGITMERVHEILRTAMPRLFNND